MQTRLTHALAFQDISSRAQIFRHKLIDEFQLFEGSSSLSTQSPMITSVEFGDAKIRETALRDTPFQLIKFKPFKRILNTTEAETAKMDRRFTRTKNRVNLPLGAWAASVVTNKHYHTLIMILIFANTISIGIDAEFSPHENEYWALFQFLSIFDLFTVCIFVIDILLKWIDDFSGFWVNGWNVADFIITIMSILPEILQSIPHQGAFISSLDSEFKTLRILRSMKLVIYFSSLKIIVLCIIDAFSSMAYIMFLVFLVAFIYAVVGVNVFYSYAISTMPGLVYQFYFKNIASIIQALFQLLTLDKWDMINRDLAKVADPSFSYLYIISWVFLGSFIFRNIFIGVMVTNFDKISQSIKEQKAEQSKIRTFEKMRRKLHKQLLTAKSNIKRSNEDLHAVEPDAETMQNVDKLILTIQRLLLESQVNSKEWESTVQETMMALSSGKQKEVVWPRDTLFRYLRNMELLQENMQEYEELSKLATWALLELNDT